MTESQIYNRALKKWGTKTQAVVLIEEMSELTKVLTKHLRSDIEAIQPSGSLVEELADVQIMLDQFKKITGVSYFNRVKAEKLKRLARMIEVTE